MVSHNPLLRVKRRPLSSSAWLRGAANTAVVLALEAADQGYDIVILEGRARLLNDPDATPLMPAFIAKYADIPRRWSAEEWAQRFSKTIQVTPTKLRGWITKPGVPPEQRSLTF